MSSLRSSSVTKKIKYYESSVDESDSSGSDSGTDESSVSESLIVKTPKKKVSSVKKTDNQGTVCHICIYMLVN